MSSRCDFPVAGEVLLEMKDGDGPAVFSSLLQSGLYVTADQPVTITGLLSSLGFDYGYIRETVQTIFLNGTAVDDLEQQISSGHAVLAVSAAMPGLAGAIFRKDSPHGTLGRSAESGGGQKGDTGPLEICVKLFNKIARDRGIEILAEGCVVRGKSLLDFLVCRPRLMSRIGSVSVDGTDVDLKNLLTWMKLKEFVCLTVRAGL